MEGVDYLTFHAGTQMSTFDMNAGDSIQVSTEWDYYGREMSRDFSVVAWGDKGALEIVHNKGLAQSSFNTIWLHMFRGLIAYLYVYLD